MNKIINEITKSKLSNVRSGNKKKHIVIDMLSKDKFNEKLACFPLFIQKSKESNKLFDDDIISVI